MSESARVWLLWPVFVLAWIFHTFSEWSYSAAEWLYKRCGTDIFSANIKWED